MKKPDLQQLNKKYSLLTPDERLKEIYNDFNISFDIFGRTSTPEQTEIAQNIFNNLDKIVKNQN